MSVRFSLIGRIAALLSLLLVVTVGAGALLGRALEPWWLAWSLPLLVTLPLLWFGLHRLLAPMVDTIHALADSAESFKDKDFSVSITSDRADELGALVSAHNELGDVFRQERQTLFQRELLLDTVIQTTDISLVLTNSNGKIVYSNAAGRQLLNQGRPINGLSFDELLKSMPRAFVDAVAHDADGLFTFDEDDPQTYHLSINEFALNAQPHKLFLFKQLTQELGRQEVATWKKVIRVISHELNNSLAPISSLAHSGRMLQGNGNTDDRLDTIFATIEDRSSHLKNFIESYAKFARLPTPQLAPVDWPSFLVRLQQTVPFTMAEELPDIDCQADATQFEQVLINLLKNAHESGSDADKIVLDVEVRGDRVLFTVSDAGGGLSDEVLQSALLPFYSTKKTGTGLGLPLCREIVEAHGGRLSLHNIEPPGLQVIVAMPNAKI